MPGKTAKEKAKARETRKAGKKVYKAASKATKKAKRVSSKANKEVIKASKAVEKQNKAKSKATAKATAKKEDYAASWRGKDGQEKMKKKRVKGSTPTVTNAYRKRMQASLYKKS